MSQTDTERPRRSRLPPDVVEQLNALSPADLNRLLSPLALRAIFMVEGFRTPREALDASPRDVALRLVRLPEYVVERVRKIEPIEGQADKIALLDVICEHYGITNWKPSEALDLGQIVDPGHLLNFGLAYMMRWHELQFEVNGLNNRHGAAVEIIESAISAEQRQALTAYREQLVADANAKRPTVRR